MHGVGIQKYFLYAIGEILLVVIGILLALQINGWNELQKQRIEENRIFHGLLKDLESDTIVLNQYIQSTQNSIRNIDTVYMALEDPTKFSGLEFLLKSFKLAYNNYFYVSSGTFDECVSTGTMKYILNDSLRQQIFEYYRIAKSNPSDNSVTKQKYEFVFPIMFNNLSTTKEYFQTMGKSTNLPAIDIAALSSNPEFIAGVNQKYSADQVQIIAWSNYLERAKNLSRNILQELEKFEND